MSAVIDHLTDNVEVRVLQDFRDASGTHVRAGERGIIRWLGVDWGGLTLQLEWERGGKRERLQFRQDAADGPGNGRMRQYFAVVRTVADTRKPAKPPAVGDGAAAVPQVPSQAVNRWEERDDAMQRIHALAAQHRFSEAEEQLRLLLQAPDGGGHQLETMTLHMQRGAESYVAHADLVLYRWWREHTISLWYAWGSMATSGGEGSARALHIRAAEASLPVR